MQRGAAHRVALGVLQDRGRAVLAELELDDGAARGQRMAQLALVDREGQRLASPP